ncbi:MAG: class I SAM-dependent methyltransferase [Desulfobacteraceae bacterium]|nr:class I SAM-dependent methyltransferase [Desulfobacteraceae bacterium]
MAEIKFVVYENQKSKNIAEEIALKTSCVSITYEEFKKTDDKGEFYFFADDKNFEIRFSNINSKAVSVDFSGGKISHRIKTSTVKNPLAKAVGLKGRMEKKPFIVDATAGLGTDSFLLYCLGARVAGFERNPFLFYLLEKGLKNYFKANENHNDLLFINSDSFNLFQKLMENNITQRPDVIYLDPMYPLENKKKAKPKKELEVLRKIIGRDNDSHFLFNEIASFKNLRIVVKRPIHSPLISDLIKPSHKIESKLVRYDVYLV